MTNTQSGERVSCTEYFDAAVTDAFPKNRSSVRILDAGAGQGSTGSYLRSLGYTNIDALTVSKERLDRAERSGLYRNLLFTALKADSTLCATGAFDAVICADGVFPDEVDPDAMDEMLRLVKPGGIVCFTMNAAQFDSAHNIYRLKCEELVTKRKWKLISQGITSQYYEPEKDNNNRYDETLPADSYVLVFMVIDNY
ncbi:malonyl-[acyl-carrier protein] O-methyltransferase-like isoform X2 [Oculina patagonica]